MSSVLDFLTRCRLLIADPHVPIWITSSLRTARELKHVHAEVAARLALHLGEGGRTKGDLGCAPTDTPRPIATSMATKHLAVVGGWLIWQAPCHPFQGAPRANGTWPQDTARAFW